MLLFANAISDTKSKIKYYFKVFLNFSNCVTCRISIRKIIRKESRKLFPVTMNKSDISHLHFLHPTFCVCFRVDPSWSCRTSRWAFRSISTTCRERTCSASTYCHMTAYWDFFCSAKPQFVSVSETHFTLLLFVGKCVHSISVNTKRRFVTNCVCIRPFSFKLPKSPEAHSHLLIMTLVLLQTYSRLRRGSCTGLPEAPIGWVMLWKREMF